MTSSGRSAGSERVLPGHVGYGRASSNDEY